MCHHFTNVDSLSQLRPEHISPIRKVNKGSQQNQSPYDDSDGQPIPKIFKGAAECRIKNNTLYSTDNLPKNSIVRFFESPTGTSRCERLGTAARDYSRLIQYSVFSRVILLVRETDSKKNNSYLFCFYYYFMLFKALANRDGSEVFEMTITCLEIVHWE